MNFLRSCLSCVREPQILDVEIGDGKDVNRDRAIGRGAEASIVHYSINFLQLLEQSAIQLNLSMVWRRPQVLSRDITSICANEPCDEV